MNTKYIPNSKTSSTTDSITYIGKINVTIKKGNKIISKQTYHNNGGTQLFKFLSSCIISDQYNVSDAPRYIKLFTFNGEVPGEPASTSICDSSIPVCAAVYYNTSELVTDSSGNSSAYLHFTIPCSAINNTSASNTTTALYQAALYSANYAKNEYKTKYSAAFNFTNGTDWSPIAVSSANGDYNIFIEWTLSFSN